MALTERNEEYITILPDGTMQVLVKTIIEKDGTEIAATNWRTIRTPDMNLDGLSGRQLDLARAVWTPDVIQRYRDKQNEQMARTP